MAEDSIGGYGNVRIVVVRDKRASWGRVCCGEVEHVGQSVRSWNRRRDRERGANMDKVRGVLYPGLGSNPCWVKRANMWGTSGG